MDYEKLYKEAISRADKHYARHIVEDIFPELKESEDEKIRKELIELVRNHAVLSLSGKMVAWIEKQEQKPRWKPTEEQMYLLNWVANTLLSNDGTVEREAAKILNGLYNGLKSL